MVGKPRSSAWKLRAESRWSRVPKDSLKLPGELSTAGLQSPLKESLSYADNIAPPIYQTQLLTHPQNANGDTETNGSSWQT